MDKELYYLLAFLASSVSAILAFTNTYILLKDRSAGLQVRFLVRKGAGSGKSYLDPRISSFTAPKAAYRIAVLVENRSSIAITVTGVSLETRRWRLVPYIGRSVVDPGGEFSAAPITTIEPHNHVIYEFSTASLDSLRPQKLFVSSTLGSTAAPVPHFLKKALASSVS